MHISSDFNRYFKLYLKCILKNKGYAFIDNHSQQSFKNEGLLLNSKNLYYTALHLKFSSLMYSAQLTDIFSYEVPKCQFFTSKSSDTHISDDFSTGTHAFSKYSLHSKGVASVVVYNFHILNTQERLYIFIASDSSIPTPSNVLRKSSKVTSLTELFFAANWLEREVSELSGVSIKDKKDLRNLMLQYGDSSAPFQKSFPSIGLKEMFYNPIKDTIIQNPVSLQL
jgi:NADH:ubiquinone oxidoreductase subunit C